MSVHSSPEATADKKKETRRFLLVDALRGFAATAVVMYHVWHKNLSPMIDRLLPEPFESIVSAGYLGVAIFFVLSGFVIAHAVFDAHITPAYFLKFILRRSIRLDLPYWFSIAVAIATLGLSHMLGRNGVVPTLGSIMAHLVYIQTFLGIPQIVGIYWTLCYEVQFYLALVLLQGLAQVLSGGSRPVKITFTYVAIFAIAWTLSLLTADSYLPTLRGLFIDRWFQFFAGVSAYWAYRGFIPSWVLAGVLVGTVAASSHPDAIRGTTVVVATLLFAASQTGHLWNASCGSVMQMLGRISYSMYLTHMLIGTRIARFGVDRYPNMGLGPAVLLLIAATMASIAFAQLMYWAIERPALALAQRVRLPRNNA